MKSISIVTLSALTFTFALIFSYYTQEIFFLFLSLLFFELITYLLFSIGKIDYDLRERGIITIFFLFGYLIGFIISGREKL